MPGLKFGIRTGCILLLLAGCISPQRTRMPSFAYGDPNAERRSFELHDPLPERDSGPLAGALPRGFDVQRAEPRRTLENFHNPLGTNPDGSAAAAPPSARYVRTVEP